MKDGLIGLALGAAIVIAIEVARHLFQRYY
jgi:hypothetical protein